MLHNNKLSMWNEMYEIMEFYIKITLESINIHTLVIIKICVHLYSA